MQTAKSALIGFSREFFKKGHQIERFGNIGNNSAALIFVQINNWLIVEVGRLAEKRWINK